MKLKICPQKEGEVETPLTDCVVEGEGISILALGWFKNLSFAEGLASALLEATLGFNEALGEAAKGLALSFGFAEEEAMSAEDLTIFK